MNYKVILCDPPWTYNDKAAAGKRGVSFKYQTMNANALSALNVQGIADGDCALFMWSTPPMMPVALEVMQHWGFLYKTIAFTWVKKTKNDKVHWGMGNYTRANPEHVLLGVKGKPKRCSASVHSFVEAKIGKHSAKPPIVRDKIVQLMGDVPRIELFARERVEGWDAWGNEVDCDIDLRPRIHFNPIQKEKSEQQMLPCINGKGDTNENGIRGSGCGNGSSDGDV